MFDSIYDTAGREWQVKAFGCCLDRYRIGDELLPVGFEARLGLTTYQVKVLGGNVPGEPWKRPTDSYATVRDGVIAAVPDERDIGLPLLDYSGGWLKV